MAKLNRNKYFTGTKKLKKVKMFEEFIQEDTIDDDSNYFVLTDGRYLFFDEEPFKDMAGETNYYLKYFVGAPGDKNPENAKEVKFNEIENLIKPKDKTQHEKDRNELGDSNAERSKQWVESKTEIDGPKMSEAAQKYWMGSVPRIDDFHQEIKDIFIDGKTTQGPWAFMTPESWEKEGVGKLGLGLGQKYQKQENGKWLKIEG